MSSSIFAANINSGERSFWIPAALGSPHHILNIHCRTTSTLRQRYVNAASTLRERCVNAASTLCLFQCFSNFHHKEKRLMKNARCHSGSTHYRHEHVQSSDNVSISQNHANSQDHHCDASAQVWEEAKGFLALPVHLCRASGVAYDASECCGVSVHGEARSEEVSPIGHCHSDTAYCCCSSSSCY